MESFSLPVELVNPPRFLFVFMSLVCISLSLWIPETWLRFYIFCYSHFLKNQWCFFLLFLKYYFLSIFPTMFSRALIFSLILNITLSFSFMFLDYVSNISPINLIFYAIQTSIPPNAVILIFNPYIIALLYLSQNTSLVQLLSRVWFVVTPWTTARQASLSITNSWNLLKLMFIIMIYILD